MSDKKICGYMSLLYSVADKPLDLWSKQVSYGGKIRRVKDDLLHGDGVIEITGPHDSTIPTSITTPAKALDVLNIKLPVLILVVKNLNLRFKLEVQIIDKAQYRRRFSFMTYDIGRLPSVNASVARVPLRLEECWNSLEINLQAVCHDAYGIDYEALQRVTVYPNCYLRRVYLQDRHYNHDETPVEMCQAFFDMYMLKWGINFMEKACQTEECYTGSLEQFDLNRLATDNSINTLPTKVDLHKSAHSMEKVKSLCPLINLYNPGVLKRNHMSLSALNDAIKMHDNQDVFTRQSECFTKSLVNDTIIENKLKRGSNDVTEKGEKQHAVKTRKAVNSLLNIKINNRTLQPASSIDLERIAKSQFLRTHVSEILFKDNRFPKRLQRIQRAGDTYINSRNCILSNDTNNVQTEKNNVNCTDVKSEESAVGFPSVSKLDLPENIKLDKISNNVSDTRSDELHVISKYKSIKENEKSIADHLRSLVSIEESTEDIIEDMPKRIPPLIEKEAKLDELKSRDTYLTTDQAVSDATAIGHFANRKLLEKLRDKGLAVPQVELLIHNLTNRRNFCGQEKFIEKQKWCTDKCIGLQ